jgi:glycosyltransferase involved in cell wall biosynthesis
MSMAQMYKAPDILIRAVAQRVEAGDDLRLVMIGDGRYLKDMQELTKTLGIGNRVRFTGKLVAGQPIRDELDQADLFVLPSRTEGLPRAMIEAMARSLPCIGSSAGGIPELLPEEDMIPPNEIEALSDKISAVLSNPDRMNRMSADNLQRSFAYRDEILRARRAAFYREIRTRTEAYIRSLK